MSIRLIMIGLVFTLIPCCIIIKIISVLSTRSASSNLYYKTVLNPDESESNKNGIPCFTIKLIRVYYKL